MLALLALFGGALVDAVTIPATSPNVKWVGRVEASGESVYFDWEGVSATVTVAPFVRLLTATINDRCNGTGAGGGSRWAVSIATADGKATPADHRVSLFYSDASISEYVLYSNPTAKCDPGCSFAGPTTFTLTRLTESRLSGCGPTGNLSVAAFTADVAFAPPPPPQPRLIEFVGDSESFLPHAPWCCGKPSPTSRRTLPHCFFFVCFF
jgi:hypothetical protein